jgi:CubicO group peptidase (beta-lactamase class C family)
VSETSNPSDVASAFDAAVQTYESEMRSEGVVGGLVYLLGRNGTVARRYFGNANLEPRFAVDDKTIVHWASVTKTFTAVAIMQLVERGLLKLDAPIVRFVPELYEAYNPFGPMEAITIEHLLSHASGLRGASWPWETDAGDKARTPTQHEPRSWSDIVALMPYTSIAFVPGSKASYSNLGYVLLGRVVERLSGDSIGVYIDKNILRPLQMYESYVDPTPFRLRSRRAGSFTKRDDKLVSNDREFATGITAANGGLNGTADDMARFAQTLMGNGTPVLETVTRQNMLRARQPFDNDKRRRVEVGLGFFISTETNASGATRASFGHSGFQLGHRSAIFMSPTGDYGFLFWANTARAKGGNPSASRLRERLVDTVFPLMFGGRS